MTAELLWQIVNACVRDKRSGQPKCHVYQFTKEHIYGFNTIIVQRGVSINRVLFENQKKVLILFN